MKAFRAFKQCCDVPILNARFGIIRHCSDELFSRFHLPSCSFNKRPAIAVNLSNSSVVKDCKLDMIAPSSAVSALKNKPLDAAGT